MAQRTKIFLGYNPRFSPNQTVDMNNLSLVVNDLSELYGYVDDINRAISAQASIAITNPLPTDEIFVGNAASVATAVPMSGDATIVASGAVTVVGIQTTPVNSGAPVLNDVLMFDGAEWLPTAIVIPPSGYTVVQVNFAASPYTIIPTTGETLYQVDCTGGDVIINFPTAVGSTATWGVQKIDSGIRTITLTPFGAQTINGAATQIIRFQWTFVEIWSNNTNLFIK